MDAGDERRGSFGPFVVRLTAVAVRRVTLGHVGRRTLPGPWGFLHCSESDVGAHVHRRVARGHERERLNEENDGRPECSEQGGASLYSATPKSTAVPMASAARAPHPPMGHAPWQPLVSVVLRGGSTAALFLMKFPFLSMASLDVVPVMLHAMRETGREPSMCSLT